MYANVHVKKKKEHSSLSPDCEGCLLTRGQCHMMAVTYDVIQIKIVWCMWCTKRWKKIAKYKKLFIIGPSSKLHCVMKVWSASNAFKYVNQILL